MCVPVRSHLPRTRTATPALSHTQMALPRSIAHVLVAKNDTAHPPLPRTFSTAHTPRNAPMSGPSPEAGRAAGLWGSGVGRPDLRGA
ncbi:hypothetical protein B0H19DRAFT_1194030, partial [Mycena capillaripes]